MPKGKRATGHSNDGPPRIVEGELQSGIKRRSPIFPASVTQGVSGYVLSGQRHDPQDSCWDYAW